MSRRIAIASAVAFLAACAARPEAAPPASPASEPAPAPSAGAPAYPAQPGAVSADAPSAGAPPPPPPAPPPAAQSQPYAQPPNRAASMTQASNDLEASQRELDVAGGDCRNACRALGSMDRAAGRLCTLAQSPDDARRCEGAKTRLYSARDKVKNTCGSCAEASVERSAPIPSR
jgi:hypothetical protein